MRWLLRKMRIAVSSTKKLQSPTVTQNGRLVFKMLLLGAGLIKHKVVGIIKVQVLGRKSSRADGYLP